MHGLIKNRCLQPNIGAVRKFVRVLHVAGRLPTQASLSFPEEPLNLGYYPATIQQKLNGDKYEIIRKLGYGPPSSTWFVLRAHDPGHFAVKIFTVAASERAKTMSKQITVMCATLEDNVPEEWLSDNEMKNYNGKDHGSATSIEAGLSDVLHKDEAAAASAFIKDCLRLDPRKRLKVAACLDHEWLSGADACSCAFC